ncbi:MAG: CsbD family protein [Candidatus Sumerlaeota bacterium]|nr:CsbD family protein [Candidatus Sumerlaeota bacterium]
MGGKTDIVKGRIEEAAGALTGNDKLRNKGKTDQAIGQVNQAVEKAVAKVSKQMRG